MEQDAGLKNQQQAVSKIAKVGTNLTKGIGKVGIKALKIIIKALKYLFVALGPVVSLILIASIILVMIVAGSVASNNGKTETANSISSSESAQYTIDFAKDKLGKKLSWFMDNDNTGRFFNNHWCAMFCGYVLENTNKDSFANSKFSASCGTWLNGLGNKFHTKDSNYVPKTGDLIFFGIWGGVKGGAHIGLVESVTKDKKTGQLTLTTIEGNTIQGPYPDNSMVGEHTFTLNKKVFNAGDSNNYSTWTYGFGEVDYKGKSVSGKYDKLLKSEITGVKTKLSVAEKDVLMRSLYREAGGTSFLCQVYVCSATLNLWDYSYSNKPLSSMLHTYTTFETAPTIDSVTEDQKKHVKDAVDYVLNGGRVKDIKYFRTNYYHDFGTPVTSIENVFFSK